VSVVTACPRPEGQLAAPVRGTSHGAREGTSADRTVKRLTYPKALRALAHPTRLALVGLLRRHGPLTATAAGELLGESSASASFHLRQLAKYDLVEEAGGGQGRQRPWRATTMFTGWPDVADSPELAAASSLLRSVLAEGYFEHLMRWLESRDSEPEAWQEAARFGDTLLYVTADELRELASDEQALMDRYVERLTRPSSVAPAKCLARQRRCGAVARPARASGRVAVPSSVAQGL
jgi:DNA-binding transcriptional ArsR family regulator